MLHHRQTTLRFASDATPSLDLASWEPDLVSLKTSFWCWFVDIPTASANHSLLASHYVKRSLSQNKIKIKKEFEDRKQRKQEVERVSPKSTKTYSAKPRPSHTNTTIQTTLESFAETGHITGWATYGVLTIVTTLAHPKLKTLSRLNISPWDTWICFHCP